MVKTDLIFRQKSGKMQISQLKANAKSLRYQIIELESTYCMMIDNLKESIDQSQNQYFEHWPYNNENEAKLMILKIGKENQILTKILKKHLKIAKVLK